MSKNELSEMIRRINDPKRKKLIITDRIETWLVSHPEGIIVPPELVPTLLMLVTKPPTTGRGGRFHSNRGTCPRAQMFTFLGFPGKRGYRPGLQNIFNDGTWRHIRWQLMGLLAGVLTDVEVYRHDPKYRIGLRADGVNFAEEFGFELKGTGNFAYVIKNGISDTHLLQIHSYFLLFPELKLWVYVAEDKRSQEWREIVIERDPRIVREVADELAYLNEQVEEKTLPPMLLPCKAQKGPIFDGCSFRDICPSQVGWPQRKRSKLPQHKAAD